MVIVLTKDLNKHPSNENITLDLKENTEINVGSFKYVGVQVSNKELTGTVFINAEQLVQSGHARYK